MKKSLSIILFLGTFITLRSGFCISLESNPSPSDNNVLPLSFTTPQENQSGMQEEICEQVYISIQKQAHYLLSTLHPWSDDSELKLLTESKSGEHWIRPNTGMLAGLSFLYRYGHYNEKIVGVSKSELLQSSIIPMMRYLIETHVSGTRPTSDGKPWGDA